MAAAKGNQNAKGNRGGKSLNDRQLSASVRTLALNEIKKVLEDPEWSEYKRQLILRLAPTLLPRLNEHTGEDGGEINVNLTNYGNIAPVQLPAKTVSATPTPSS